MSEALTITKNQFGNNLLIHDGFRYNFNVRNKNSNNWRCVNKRSENCNASITLDLTNKTILRCSQHFCQRNVDKCKVIIAMNQCKQEVCDDLGSVSIIVEKKLEALGNDGVRGLPTVKEVQDSMYRARKKFLNCDKLTYRRLEDVEVPDVLANKFLLCSDGDTEKILIFCSPTARKFINFFGSDMYFGDGTFKSAPPPFAQLYTINMDLNSTDTVTHVIPVIFALLPNKKYETYMRMFDLLKNKLSLTMNVFKTDYEAAVIKAIKTVYPQITVSGCYYHMSKAVWRNAKRLNCIKTKDDRRMVRLAANLPLLPAKFIIPCWQNILDISPTTVSCQKFKKYFEREWLTQDFLNVISVSEIRHRTNNALEGWNHRINTRIIKNPALCDFVHKIKRESKKWDTTIKDFIWKISKKSNRRNADIGFDRAYIKMLKKLRAKKITALNFLKKLIILKLLK